jgi:hypothetical protein
MKRRDSVIALLALGSVAGTPGVRAQGGALAQRRTLGS